MANLTSAQRERLEVLIEEAAEVIQCGTKILRHGYSSSNPDDETKGNNKRQLTNELLEMWTIMERMNNCGDIPRLNYHLIGDVWKQKLRYMYHQSDPRDQKEKPSG